ncbi:MAG TPA: MBL fold metallo-hydrolase, partial [Terriglobia bacterium]|nr:MBL fold metallo-hydrolase [Terriglobia bacterium]
MIVLLAASFSAGVFLIRHSPRVVSAASGLYEVHEIKPHVFVWQPEDIVDLEGDPEFARTGTAGFVLTAEGVVVIDTTNSPFHARELLYEIRQRTEEPVRYVIDTDSEGEYTLGNEVFSDLQAAILGSPGTQAEIRRYQKNLVRRLEGDWRLQTRMRGMHPTPPNQTADAGATLRLGGIEIRLTNFPTGLAGEPLTADTVAYLPAAKVAFAGGLIENGYYPRLAWRERG